MSFVLFSTIFVGLTLSICELERKKTQSHLISHAPGGLYPVVAPGVDSALESDGRQPT